MPKIFPKTTPNFFCWFRMKCAGDLINIDSFNCNPVVLKKKMVKPLKITIFGPNLRQKRVTMSRAQNKKFFSTEISVTKVICQQSLYCIGIPKKLLSLIHSFRNHLYRVSISTMEWNGFFAILLLQFRRNYLQWFLCQSIAIHTDRRIKFFENF